MIIYQLVTDKNYSDLFRFIPIYSDLYPHNPHHGPLVGAGSRSRYMLERIISIEMRFLCRFNLYKRRSHPPLYNYTGEMRSLVIAQREVGRNVVISPENKVFELEDYLLFQFNPAMRLAIPCQCLCISLSECA